jgi:hypothetical protein
MARTTKRGRAGRSRDRKLVAGRQKHEVRYTAKKTGVKGRAVKKAVKRVGHSRSKVERALRTVKKAVKTVAAAPVKVVQAITSTSDSSSPETKGE